MNNSIDKTRSALVLFNKDWNTYKINWQSANSLFGKIGSLFASTKINQKDIEAIKAYNSQIDSCVTSQTAFNRTMLNASPAAQNLVASYNGAKVSAEELIVAQNTLNLSAKAGQIALKALSIAGNMILFMAISKGIQLAVKWIDKLVHSAEYAEKAFKAATDSAKSFSDTIKDIQKETVDMGKSVDSIIDRYAKLSQGVNAFTNENQSLPTDQYEEFLELNKQLAELFPSLTRNYDENGNAILGLSGSVDSVTESIKALVKQEKELAKAKIRENIEQYFDGTDEADGAWKALEGRKQKLEEANEAITTLKKTYEDLINADASTVVGQYHKNFVGKEQAKYIEYIKNNFGEDIAEAMEDAISIHLGKGLNGQFADLVVDFSNLELTEIQKEQITRSYDTFYSELLAKQKTALSEFDSQNSEFSNNAMLWLEDLSFYKDSSKYVQTAIQNLVRSIDWSNYDFEELNYDGVKRILQDSILTPFQVACDNPDAKKSLDEALKSLFTLNTSDMPVSEIKSVIDAYIDFIAKEIDENPLELKIRLGFGDTVDAAKQLQNSIRQITDDHGTADHEEYAILSKYTKDFTQAQAELWLEATLGAQSATEAIEMYGQKLSEIDSSPTSTLFDQLTSSQESLDKFQSSVKSASEAYATLLSGNYSSTELLDSIQAINEAVTDMKGSINWEEIDSLDLLGDKLEEVSRDYAESILSGSGIGINSDFGKMLTNIISQMFEVEDKFAEMNAQLDKLQSSYQTLTGILESYNETGYISLDNLQSLLTADENLIAMLEVENGKLTINQEAYENLVAVQLQEFKEKLNNAAAAEIEALALNKAEEATNNNANASEDAVAKLDAETEAFKRNTEAASENALTKAIADAKEKGVSKEEIQGVLDKYTKIWNAAMDNYSTDFPTFMNGAKSSASSAGEDAGKAFTEALEKELNALDTKMEAGYIDFNDYIQARLDLIEDYYRQGKIKADVYYSYLEKHYDKQLTYMDKAVSAVTRRIDKEIDALEKQKDDVESIYQVQIDALEKQKTLLEEANKAREREYNLQKFLYELERARNQNSKLVNYMPDTIVI